MGWGNVSTFLVQIIVVVPGKFNIAKGKGEKRENWVMTEPLIFIFEWKKEMSVALFNFVKLHVLVRKRKNCFIIYVWLVRALNWCVKSPNPTKVFG